MRVSLNFALFLLLVNSNSVVVSGADEALFVGRQLDDSRAGLNTNTLEEISPKESEDTYRKLRMNVQSPTNRSMNKNKNKNMKKKRQNRL